MTMIKLILNSDIETEAMVEYIEEIIETIRLEREQCISGTIESLKNSAEAELMNNLLKKLKKKQIDNKKRITLDLLEMQALLLIRYNEQAFNAYRLNPYFGNILQSKSSDLHKQLINN